MCAQEIPEAKSADVVISGFYDYELVEMRRGLVQRMTVAQANIRDKRNTDDLPDWRDMYEACWSAYSKITKALGGSFATTVEHPNHTLLAEPPCDDEFDYLSRPVGKD